jgi:hypothetical protein
MNMGWEGEYVVKERGSVIRFETGGWQKNAGVRKSADEK